MPAVWVSKYVVMWYCKSSHRSSTMSWGAPASRFSWSRWLMRITSTSLCVRSSSDRSPDSSVIEGPWGGAPQPLAHLAGRHLVAVLAERGGLVDVDRAVLLVAVGARLGER